MPRGAEAGTNGVGQNIPQNSGKCLGGADRVIQQLMFPETAGTPEEQVRFVCRLALQCAESPGSVLLLAMGPARIDHTVQMIRHDAEYQEVVLRAVLLLQGFGKHGGDRSFREPFGTGPMLPEMTVEFLQAGQLFFRTNCVLSRCLRKLRQDLPAGLPVLHKFVEDVCGQRSRQTQRGKTGCRSRVVQWQLNAMRRMVR